MICSGFVAIKSATREALCLRSRSQAQKPHPDSRPPIHANPAPEASDHRDFAKFHLRSYTEDPYRNDFRIGTSARCRDGLGPWSKIYKGWPSRYPGESLSEVAVHPAPHKAAG